MMLEHFLAPYKKINSKWIKDLNVRSETIKFLEENIGKTLSEVNHSRILYDPPPTVMEIKAKIRPGADCGSDHEFLIAKFRLKLKKIGETTRPFRHDLNQISYDYTMEVTNTFKALDLIECLKNYG